MRTAATIAIPGSGPRPYGSVRPRASRRLGLSRGWLGLAGLALTGLVTVLCATQTGLLLPGSFHGIPQGLAGAFKHSGVNLGLAGLIAVLGLMFFSYVVVVRAADELSGPVVLTCIAGLTALVLLGPPLLSTDVFSYTAYGRIGAIYGSNPYFHGPNIIASDPSYPLIGALWTSTPTVYGPLFTALSYLLAPLGVASSVLAYKAIAAASCLIIVSMVWKSARLCSLDPVRAVALVGLNPVILIHGVGGGHNDMLMLALLTTSMYLLLRQRERAGGALIVAATAIKLTAGLLLPFVLAERGNRRHSVSNRRAVLTGAILAATTVVVLSFVMFGAGPLQLIATLRTIQAHGGLNSISGCVLAALGLSQFNGPVALLLDVTVAVWVAWLLRRVWSGRLDWVTAAGWATVALLISAGLLLPWYMAWLVPLAALSSDRRLLVTTVFMTGLGLTSL